MLLAVDIGNTNIVVALFHEEELVHEWRMYSDPNRTSDEYSSILFSLMRDAGVTLASINSSILSSVVPLLIGPFITVLERITGKKPFIVGPAIYDKLAIKIPTQAVHEIGTDIVCNAVEAYASLNSPCITVDFGTALTLTAISGKGEILGVSIAAELRTALNSPLHNTAQMPAVPLEAPPDSLGTNTIHSIQSGIVLGYKGLVEFLIERMRSDMCAKTGASASDIKIIATGGLNSVLKPITSVFQTVDKQLTLKGLRRIASLLE